MMKKKYEKWEFVSLFTNAPTLAEAKKKLRYFHTRRTHGSKMVFTSHYGGKTGDKYGKNYWFGGYVLYPKSKLQDVV